MKIDTAYLERCIATLDKALTLLKQSSPDNIDYDLYRSACVKEFEIILEQCGKLLRKALKPYFHSSKAVDQLIFKDVFRNAVLRNIILFEEGERWLQYCDNRKVPRTTMVLTLQKRQFYCFLNLSQMPENW